VFPNYIAIDKYKEVGNYNTIIIEKAKSYLLLYNIYY